MTNLLANPFETIAAQPRVVPQAVERVIQAGVDADYLNRRAALKAEKEAFAS